MIRHSLLGLLLLPFAALAGTGSNYAECLIENMPGVANEQAHWAGLNMCRSAHPQQFTNIEKGSGQGFFSKQTPEQCTLTKARDTRWQYSANMIRAACDCLYAAPETPARMCDGRLVPDPKIEAKTREAARIGAAGANSEFKQSPPEGVISGSAHADDKAIVYELVIGIRKDATEAQLKEWRSAVRSETRSSACPVLQENEFYTSGLSFRYRYFNRDGTLLNDFWVDKVACEASSTINDFLDN